MLKKRALKIALMVLVGGLFVWVIASVLIAHHLASQDLSQLKKIQSQYSKYHQAILEDFMRLEAAPPFPDRPRLKDAQALLSQYVSWDGIAFANSNTNSYLFIKELAKKYPKLGSDPQQLKTLLGEKDTLDRIDSSWMDALQTYDHISIYTYPEVAQRLAKLRLANGVERLGLIRMLPLINYRELVSWAEVYLLKSYLQGRPLQGLQMFRKVAELIHSSNTLVGNMMAAIMLKSEHFYATQFGLQGRSLVESEKVEAYRRLSWAMALIVNTPFYGELPTEYERFMKPQHGLCAGVDEALAFTALRDYLEPRFLFEINFEAEFAESHKRLSSYMAKCGQESLLTLLSPVPPEANPFILDCGKEPSKVANVAADSSSLEANQCTGYVLNKARIPFIRRALALNLLTIATPNFLRLYENPSAVGE